MSKLSVIIPSYNEARNIANGALFQVEKYLSDVKYAYEVLIVDDGSSDESVNLIENIIRNKKEFSLIKNPHQGKAMTVITGLMQASGEIAVFTDMDQATPISEIEKFLPKFSKGYDIIIGSRQGRKGAPLVRKIISWGFSFLRNIILGLPFKDTQCGFKAFNHRAIQEIFPKIQDEWGVLHTRGGAVNAGFDVEVLYLAKKYGFKVAEVEVEWNYVDTERVQIIKDALAAIYDMLSIRANDLMGKYG